MPDHFSSKEIFPNMQSKPPLMQLEVISSHPIASYLGEERKKKKKKKKKKEKIKFFKYITVFSISISKNDQSNI